MYYFVKALRGHFERNIDNEPSHEKPCETYNKTCVISKDSDQPVHPLNTASVHAYPSFDSLKALEGT